MHDDITRNYHGGNECSQEAFKKIKPHIGTIDDRIIAFMKTKPLGQTTSEEVEKELGMKHQSASAALTRLKDAGRIGEVFETHRQKKINGYGVVGLLSSEWLKDMEQGQQTFGRALCKSCRKEVIYLAHERTGNVACIDAQKREGGNIAIDEGRGVYRVIKKDHIKAFEAEHGRKPAAYVDHHYTCPDADKFRRKK